MDTDRFDSLTRSLSTSRSRRGALTALLGGTLGLLGLSETDARKRKGEKKKKGGSPPGPTCSDGIQNGGESDVDCGGPCARCANGKRCFNGAQNNRDDCASAACSPFGYCFACTEHSQCPGNQYESCGCRNGACVGVTYIQRESCGACPANTGSCEAAGVGLVACYRLCGAA